MKQKLSLLFILLTTAAISPPAKAIDLSAIKKQGNLISEKLAHEYQSQPITKRFAINDISHQYLMGYGQVFTVETNVDFLPILNSISSDSQHSHSNSVLSQTKNHKPKPHEQKTLANLQLEQRNLAHHEFSLHKKIESMQQQSKTSNQESTMQKLDQNIRKSQSELDQLREKKQLIAIQIQNKKMANIMKQSSSTSTPSVSRQTIYQNMLKKTYELVCSDNLLSSLPENEHLTVIFTGLGDVEKDNYNDEVLVMNNNSIAKCQSQEITVTQLDTQVEKYQY